MEQDRIDETLQYLPIFVMACRYTLALCGKSYFDRLWCVWELFNANVRPHGLDNALFWSPPGSCLFEIKYTAASFTAAKAKCFDPNDTRRIHEIINGMRGGIGVFETAIRDLAGQIGTTDKYSFEGALEGVKDEVRRPSVIGPSGAGDTATGHKGRRTARWRKAMGGGGRGVLGCCRRQQGAAVVQPDAF